MKLGSKPIGRGKREAASITCGSNGESRGSGIDANSQQLVLKLAARVADLENRPSLQEQ
jgi:hypothetical protein